MEGDNVSKVEINVHDGGQINFVKDNGSINAVQNNTNEKVVNRSKIKSRTQEYADKWNANMFLNDFNKRDENAGVNIKLSDVYLEEHLPHYIWGENKAEDTDLKELLTEYIEEKYENKMLLILGLPGIGKSTLITWITAHFGDRIDDILVYKFASNFKNVDWEKPNVHLIILEALSLSYDDLERKTLILDGFDEISIGANRREVLDNLYGGFIYKNNIKNFSLIVTCRENYIQGFERVKCSYIRLQPWDDVQIQSFCNIFQEKTKNKISEDTIEKFVASKKIFGIPLILYMVLALNITFENDGSIVDVYDKIFALEGGIYDRCIDNKSFADRHRISEIKKYIHQISREIAIWMFENNPDEAYIPQREYQKICLDVIQENTQKNKDLEQDFMIGNFFRLRHCEGMDGNQLYFIHRSIYEYFVIEYIYISIYEMIDLSKEDLAGILGKFLSRNILSRYMIKYLKTKILKSKLQYKFKIIEDTFQIMLRDGMTYYSSIKFKIFYKNVIKCETNVFKNMLEILHFCDDNCLIFDDENCLYIKCNGNDYPFNLAEVVLKETKLKGVDLEKANLKGANFVRADLRGANLKEADLEGANLKGADLRGADLRGTDLSEADLRGTDLQNANLKEAKLNAAKLGRTNLSNTNFGEIDVLKSKLEKMDLKEINLSNTNLVHFNLSNLDLSNSCLSKTILYKSNLQKVNLYKANLLWANLRGANLRGADLRLADLRLADLREIDLHEVDLKGANLMFTKFDEEQITYLLNYDLSKSLVYVEECGGFIDYLKYNMKKDLYHNT